MILQKLLETQTNDILLLPLIVQKYFGAEYITINRRRDEKFRM